MQPTSNRPKFSLLLWPLLACLSCFISNTARAQTTAVPSPTGSISGRITIESKPAANFMVVVRTLYDEGRPISLAGKVRTDGDGRFQIGNLPPGKYSVEPIAPAYFYTDFKERSVYNDAGKVIALGEGEIIRDIELDLQRGGVITGRVTDNEGRPLTAQVVWLMMLEPKIESAPVKARPGEISLSVNGIPDDDRLRFIRTLQVTTDDRGIYRYYGLTPGRYVVMSGKSPNDSGPRAISARTLNSYYRAAYYPAAVTAEQATPVEVTAGSEAANIDLNLGKQLRGFKVSGRLVSTKVGASFDEAHVYADRIEIGARSATPYLSSVRVTAQGEFTLVGLDPGQYLIRASVGANQRGFFQPARVEISDHDVNGVEFRLNSGLTVSGTVVVENTSGGALPFSMDQLKLTVSSNSRETGAITTETAVIKPDGSFSVSGLTPGRVLFLWDSPVKGLGLRNVERNGVRIPGAMLSSESDEGELPVGFPVDADNPGSGLVVRAAYGNCIVRGEVKPAGEPWPEAATVTVNLRRTDRTGRALQARADARGRFLFEGLRPGEYEVEAAVFPSGSTPSPFYLNGKSTVLVANETPTVVTITVAKPSRSQP